MADTTFVAQAAGFTPGVTHQQLLAAPTAAQKTRQQGAARSRCAATFPLFKLAAVVGEHLLNALKLFPADIALVLVLEQDASIGIAFGDRALARAVPLPNDFRLLLSVDIGSGINRTRQNAIEC